MATGGDIAPVAATIDRCPYLPDMAAFPTRQRMNLRVRWTGATLLLALFAVSASQAKGQLVCPQPQPRFDRFSVEDGLSANYVRSVYQDKTGFLWFGTADGLNRYDGQEFRVYRHEPDDATSIVGNIINDIAEDATGHLWIATANGISRLDPTTQQAKSYAFPEPSGPASSRASDPNESPRLSVRAVEIDSSGTVWIATRGGGLGGLQPGADQFTFLRADHTDPATIPGDSVSTIFVDQRGTLWTATQGKGLSRYDAASGTFTHFRHDPADRTTLASHFIRSLGQDSSGALIIGLWRGGVDRMPLDQPGVFEHLVGHWAGHGPTGGDHNVLTLDLRGAMADRSGAVWVSTFAPSLERVRFDESGTPHVTRFSNEPSDVNSLGDTDILSIYEDRRGNMWFGGWRGGVSRYDPTAATYCHVRHAGSDAASIPSNNVTALLASADGTIWVGTSDAGLARYVPEQRGFVVYQHRGDDPTSLPDNRITSLHLDSSGQLWVGSFQQGLARFDPDREAFVRFPRPAQGATVGVAVMSPSSDAEFFWIGTSNGVSRWYPGTGTYENLFRDFRHARFPKAIVEDGQGTLWVAFDDGRVFLRDGHTGEATEIHFVPAVPAGVSLHAARTLVLHEDQAGRVWAGTQNGLFLLDRNAREHKRYGVADGLPSLIVNSIEEDASGALWLGTHNGLSRFDPTTESFANYGPGDGLQGRRFGKGSYRGPSGELLFGGINGFNIFDPAKIVNEPAPLRALFTSLTRPDTTIDLTVRSHIQLPYRHRLLTLTVAALGPIRADAIEYVYQLDDDGWNNLGGRNQLALAGLSPGTYKVRLRASSTSGNWTPDESSLTITIRPPWWRTGWAFGTWFALAALLLYGGLRYERNRALLKERLRLEHETTRKLRELDETKSRFLANLSHEFRTPLTLIVGPLQQLLAEHGDDRHGLILRNAHRLQRLINQVLELSKLEEGAVTLHRTNGDLGAFARRVVLAMTPLAEREGVTLVPPDTTNLFADFDTEQMERVVGNLVSNALKFTPRGGSVNVTARSESGDVILEVADTGIGIAPEHLPHVFDRFFQVDATSRRRYEGTGIGLALAKELVELHGGSLSAASTPGQGATFTMRMPASAQHVTSAVEAEPVMVASEVATTESGNGTYVHRADNEDCPRVLIIDDNPDIRTYVRSLLYPAYDVLEAYDGQHGLDVARAELPDVVIADVMMPRLDGLEFTRAVRSDAVLTGVPVILLTARSQPADVATGFDAGADQFVSKPFEANVLVARVASVLAQRRRLKEAYTSDQKAKRPEHADPLAERLVSVVCEHLQDSTFNVEKLADEMAMSASQLRRRTKELLDVGPNALIRRERLARAELLLRDGTGSVSEVAYACGFNSIHYFSRAYRAHFGVAPSAHASVTES